MAGIVTAASLAVAVGTLATGAQASVLTFTLDQDGCSGTCGTGPYGTITIEDFGSGTGATVHVLETLAAGIRFADTGAGPSLAFNISAFAAPITISNLTLGFHIGPSPESASTFGVFSNSVECNSKVNKGVPQPLPITCQGGSAGNTAGPLAFDVSSAVGVTTADFIANLKGYFFASDIVGFNGNTGNVAAIGIVTSGCENGDVGACGVAVSEPGLLWLMILGLLGLGALAQVRKLRA